MAVISATRAAKSFADFGVAAEIVDALATRGIERPFAIQELTLPLALRGSDIIGQARTGTGKTYGFGVPLLDRVFDDATVTAPDGSPRALVVVPTRELCIQVASDLSIAAQFLVVNGRSLAVEAIYGGVPMDKQDRALRAGADVVVGTPGRLLDLARQGILALGGVEIVVLDEADEMLDQGFLDDVTDIVSSTNPQRQTMLFSATLPGPIMALTRRFMTRPVRVQAEDTESTATHSSTTQLVFQSHRMDRLSTLSRVLQSSGRGRTIVFAKTKRTAAQVAEDLANLGFRVAALHGDMKQSDREESLSHFRDGAVDIVVATDVAARGIDVDDVTHVINYQVPDDERIYVHRIGRTGRAGNSGTAITLVGWDEVDRWKHIDSSLNLGHPDPPQWFSSSPEFLRAFDLPDNISDHVGSARRVVGADSSTALLRRAPRKRVNR